MSDDVDDDVHLLAGSYALGALDADEEARFAEHLATCAACRAEVDGFAAVRDQLGQAAAEPAPAGLRARVLAAAAATPQEPVLPTGRRPARSRWQPAGRAALAVAAAVVVILGGFAVSRLRAERSSAEEIVAVLTARDATTVPLTGDDAADLRVTWSASEGAAVLVADALDPPGAGRDYELWFLDGSTAESALVFEPDEGRVQRRFDVPAAGFEGLAVTVEPDGGSDEPTLPPRYVSETLA
jgi:anti-sigma-K factor RskA